MLSFVRRTIIFCYEKITVTALCKQSEIILIWSGGAYFYRHMQNRRCTAERNVFRMKRGFSRPTFALVLLAMLTGISYMLWSHSFADL